MKLRVWSLWLLALAIVACDSADGGPAGAGDVTAEDTGTVAGALTYYEHARPILNQKCAPCHSEGQIAPFSLTEYEQAYGLRASIRGAVEEGRMPPWPADDTCRNYVGRNSLAPPQRDTLLQWIDEGAAEGDPEGAPPAPIPEPTTISRVDLTLPMPAEYTPQVEPNDYRCFLLEWPHDTTKFITGFQAVRGNPAIVHHIAVYLIPPALADSARERAAGDPAQSWECFGGPNVSDNRLDPFVLVGIWGPGMVTRDFPEGTGLRVEPGSVLALQMHYATLSGSGSDLTSLQFKIDDEVDKEGAMLPFLDLAWPSNYTMDIPADEADVMHSFADDVAANALYGAYTNGVLKPGEPFRIHAVNLHMHMRGSYTRTSLRRAGGDEVCLLDIPAFDFHWQFFYPLTEAVDVYPGDQLYVECHWDNSAAGQPVVGGSPLPVQDLNWGEGSNEEMCVGTYFVSAL